MAYFGFTQSFGNNRRRCDVHALISRGCNTSQFGPHISPIYHIRMVARCSKRIHIRRISYQSRTIRPRYGFILFIVSEVMFFFALFRASSHSSLAPTVDIRGIWPPKGIVVLDTWEIPFLNTLIPLSFGAAVTWAHHAILAGKEKREVYALVATVSLDLVFTSFQGMEYYQAPFTILDSIYGSTFFLATGFHGFHVIIGTIFSIIYGIHQYLGHLTKDHHVGFEAAAWYWHFVDVVRLLLFVSIYWWGENRAFPKNYCSFPTPFDYHIEKDLQYWMAHIGKVKEIQSLFLGAEQSKNEPNQMIVLKWLFLTIAPCDLVEPWQLGSQDAATPIMQGITDLHHDVFFFVILILVFVSWILGRALWHFHYKKNPIPQRIVHGTTIEILWTIFPNIIPMFIAIPSFALLYSIDEVVVDPAITIKAIRHQWYRSAPLHEGD
ncbi:hypothetical protein P3S67_010172 [Capsicum chacoense]